MARPKKSRFGKSRADLRNRAKKSGKKHTSNALASLFKNTKDLKTWEPKEVGEYTLRVYPYLQTSEFHPDFYGEKIEVGNDIHYRRPFGVHYINKKPYICPKKTFDKNCPICDSIPDYWDDYKKLTKGTPEAKAQLKLINSTEASEWVSIIADVTNEDNETSRVIFTSKYSKYCKHLDDIVRALRNEEPDERNEDKREDKEKEYEQIRKRLNPDKFDGKEVDLFYFFEDGFDIVLDVQSCGEAPYTYKGLKTWKDIEFKERDDISEDIVDEVPELDDCFIVKSYQELKDIYEDGGDFSEEKDPEPESFEEETSDASENNTESETTSEPETVPEEESWESDNSEPEPEEPTNNTSSDDGEDDDW